LADLDLRAGTALICLSGTRLGCPLLLPHSLFSAPYFGLLVCLI